MMRRATRAFGVPATGWYVGEGGSPERHYAVKGARVALCAARVRDWPADAHRPVCPSCAYSLRRGQKGAA